jgi:uncharacterized membrane protein YfcA
MEYIIGLIIGAMLGLSGAGGVIAIPLIIIFLHLPVNEAMGAALGAVMLSAVIGVYSQRKLILCVPALILGFTGMLTAPLGRSLAMSIDDFLLLFCFFIISMAIAIGMWMKSSKRSIGDSSYGLDELGKSLVDVPRVGDFFKVNSISNAESARVKQIVNSVLRTIKSSWVILATMLLWGLFVGAVSGLMGIGGGVLIIPFLHWYLRVNMKIALATSLLVVLLISASGFFTSLIVYQQVDLLLFAKLAIAAMVGIVLGHKLGSFCPDHLLQKIFSISLVCISLLAIASEL